MKISCQSCQAKYTIADEKVVGKVVKIRCKKCSATIVVNGNESDAGGAVADYTAGSDEQWTVNVADGDQRTMTMQEIVQEFKNGVVTDETYCWKDGMNDWLPLREIEELQQAVTLGPAPTLSTSADGFQPLSLSPQVPAAEPAGGGFGLFGGAGTEAEHTEVNGGGALFGSSGGAAASGAARRVGGRQTGNADLFGGAAQAGSESEVTTSAGGAAGADGKMTGARNENSVLFSLSALTNDSPNGAAAPKAKESGPSGGAQADGSGLIDIRALASSMGVDQNKKDNKVDDIMNLSGGGAFSAALAAPVLAPPPADLGGMAGPGDEKKSNKTMFMVFGAAGILGVFVLAAAFIFAGGKKDDKEGATKDGVKTSETTDKTGDKPSEAAKPAETQAAPTSTTQATPPSTGVVAAAEKPAGPAKGTGGGTKAAATPTPEEKATPTPPAAPAAPSKPKSLADAMNESTGKKPEAAAAPAGGGGTAPFDKGAASASLSAVVGNLASCKKPDGPTGAGKVKVTFEPNGSVSKVEFAEGSFAGTPVGGCILGKFRGARVPAFAGSSITAGKSFSL